MINNRYSSELTNIFLTGLEFIGSIVLIYFVAVTFGASLIDSMPQTLFFSLFMAIICVAPSIILFEHTDPLSLFDRLFIKQEFRGDAEYRFMRISLNSVLGAWLGALVIPLDWDRWWQEWPISCCFGAILGAFYGALTGSRSGNKIKSGQ